MMEYVSEFVSDAATGQDGYLTDKGLIPLPADRHAAQLASTMELETLSASDF
jgi:phosphate transport system substrate-binding protein